MRILVLFVVALLAACGDPDATTSWNHDPGDAASGPQGWGELDEACFSGSEQSPVDIASPVDADLPPLEFDYAETELKIENTGHTVEVPMPEESDNTLTIDGDEYRLVQYHFHAPSEHTVDGSSHDVEGHLVHENEDGELAVVGVFFEAGDSGSDLFDVVLTNAPEQAGEEAETGEQRNPIELLPVAGSTTIDGYYTYPGSLTTPGCNEGVRWTVIQDTMTASSTSIDHFHHLISEFPGYDGYENNNRPTQPLNERQIESSQGS
jgi:carbonic anhydrase